jgi:peptide/nickel transport system substrate-binding protein
MMKKVGMVVFSVVLLLGLASGPVFAVRSGGTLIYMAPYGGDVGTLDPHLSTRIQDFLVTKNIHRSIYCWDADTSKPALDLAEKVDISADGLVWTFSLKKNVKFHNGRGMTADDVIWSFERIMNPKTASSGARYLRSIKGAKDMEDGKAEHISGLRKIDGYTLEITLEEPVDLSYSLYDPGVAILPREEVEKRGAEFGINPVGNGPFQFVSWVKGSEIVLKKFPDFYDAGKPYLDKLVIKIMAEGAARDIAFKAKDLDVNIVEEAQYPEYKNDPVISKHMVEVAEMFTRLIVFNLDYEPFKSKQVRQAINYAIDSKLIIDKLQKGKAFPCKGYLPPAFEPTAKGYTYDPEKAAELMKQAGYEKGFEFECLATANKSWGVPVVEAIMPYLKKINITVKPQLMEGAALAARAKAGDFQALIWSLDSGPDPVVTMERWQSKNLRSSGNYADYKNPEYDKLVDMAAAERDPAKRMDLVRQADALFCDDAPVWFFNYNKAIMAYQPWVHGVKPVAVEMMYQDPMDFWIDETSPRANEK